MSGRKETIVVLVRTTKDGSGSLHWRLLAIYVSCGALARQTACRPARRNVSSVCLRSYGRGRWAKEDGDQGRHVI